MREVMNEKPARILKDSPLRPQRTVSRLAFAALCAAFSSPTAAAPVSCPGYETSNAQGHSHEVFIRAYIDCFNNQDFDCLDRIYADDLRYEGQYWTLSSKEDFFDFYRKAWGRLKERITVSEVRSAGDKAFVDLQNRIEVFKDYPDFPSRALMAGDILNLEGTVAYTIQNNRITHICDR